MPAPAECSPGQPSHTAEEKATDAYLDTAVPWHQYRPERIAAPQVATRQQTPDEARHRSVRRSPARFRAAVGQSAET